MSLSELPFLNACLNGTCAMLLVCGYTSILLKKETLHRVFMSLAFVVSTLFLISYLYYHAHAGSKPYQGVGLLRTIYFVILITHSILAAIVVPFILKTIYLAVSNQRLAHRQLARLTLPMWLYVSVTGVVIYRMLY